jgi:hypothetical protein
MEANVSSPFQLFGHPFTFSARGLAKPGRRNRSPNIWHAHDLAGRAWAESKRTLILRTSFSTKKVYRSLVGTCETPEAILDIWKTCNLPRQKFFAWLLLQERLNTKDLMVK